MLDGPSLFFFFLSNKITHLESKLEHDTTSMMFM